MVGCHQNSWKKYVDGKKLKCVPFHQWRFKKILGESFFIGSYIVTNMKRLDLFLDIFPIEEFKMIVTLINAELRRKILPATKLFEIINKAISMLTHASDGAIYLDSRSDLCIGCEISCSDIDEWGLIE